MIGRFESWLDPEEDGLEVPVSVAAPKTEDVPTSGDDSVKGSVAVDEDPLESVDEVSWMEDREVASPVDVDVSEVLVDCWPVEVVEASTVSDVDAVAAADAAEAADARIEVTWVKTE